jgi:hypothetical protein
MSVPSSFNVSSSSGPLGSFLQTAPSSSLLGALNNTSSAATTANALRTGGMTSLEHNALVSIQAAGSSGEDIGWNANGTEPSTLANMRSSGWIKLTKKTFTDGKPSGGVYTLTTVGKALFERTGGGLVGTNGSDASAGGLSDSTKQALTSAVGGVENLLAALSGGSSSSSSLPGISTGSTGNSALNILA